MYFYVLVFGQWKCYLKSLEYVVRTAVFSRHVLQQHDASLNVIREIATTSRVHIWFNFYPYEIIIDWW